MRRAIAFLAPLAFAPLVYAGTLTTLDGRSFDGTITFDSSNALLVTRKDGAKQQIELSNVLQAVFRTSNRPLSRGVLLIDGEAIAADAITAFDSSGVRLVRPGGIAVNIPASDLAIVYFRPVTAEMLKRVLPGHAGAILDNGDFFEGDPAGFDGGQVKISSVLFGIQSFDISRQARAVIVQDATAPDAKQVVHLNDGSVLLAKSLAISDGRLTIDDQRLGAMAVEGRDVTEITLGSSAFDGLSQMPPEKVDGPPGSYAIDSTTANVPMTLLGVTAAHGICEQPGISITWNLAGKYKSAIAKAGVPLGLVPVRRLQFVILADGREVFRSTPRSSVDEPVLVALSMEGVQSMTLRVEGAGTDAAGAAGLWADPILVRADAIK